MCDVKGRKVLEKLNWMWAHWGSEQQEELWYQITYHTYVASGGDCYTHQAFNL